MPQTRQPFIGLTHYWNQGWSTCSTQGPIRVGNRFPDEDPRLKGGEMSIEVWDGNGHPIEGYCGDRRAPFTENTPSRGDMDAATIRWPDDRSMNELAGREIRLVFYMRDSHLYNFRSSG